MPRFLVPPAHRATRRALTVAVLWTVLVAAATPGSAGGDEVFLTGGRSFKGRIVKETDDAVTIRFSGGSMTIERYRIDRIQRDEPETKEPVPEPRRDPVVVGGSKAHSGGAKTPSEADVREVKEQVHSMDTRKLDPWEPEQPHALQGVDYKRYKVIDARGALEQAAELPKSPRDIDRVYERKHLPRAVEVTGSSEKTKIAWVRMYWDEGHTQWTTTHPAEQALLREDQDVKQIVRRIGDLRDAAAIRRCDRAVEAILRKMTETATPDLTTETREIQEQARRAGGAGRGGQVLAEIYDLNVVVLQGTPAERIRGALRRRNLVHEILDLTGF